MTTAIILLSSLLLAPLAPDLCDDVYLNADNEPITDAYGTTLSRFCEWTGPDAPVWDDDLCCTTGAVGAECTPATLESSCPTGKRMYCEYGELLADSSVVCYQPFPATCESSCGEPAATIQAPDYIQETLLCCYNGNCYDFSPALGDTCPGELSWCYWGYLLEDGTVDCYD